MNKLITKADLAKVAVSASFSIIKFTCCLTKKGKSEHRKVRVYAYMGN